MAVVLAGAPYVQPSGVVLIVLAGHSIAVVLARPHRYGHYGMISSYRGDTPYA